MKKNKLNIAWLLLASIVVVFGQVSAQTPTATITTPMNGFITIAGNLAGTVQGESNTQLLRLNTVTGALDVLLDDTMPFSSLRISRSGDRVAFYQPQQGLSTYDFATDTKINVIPPDFAVVSPQSWSAGDTDLLNIDFRYNSNSQTFLYEIQQFALDGSTTLTLINQVRGQPLTAVSLPNDVAQLSVDSIEQAMWNPVFHHWILLKIVGTHPNILTVEGYEKPIQVTVLYNTQTGQSISLNDLISDEIASEPVFWSSSGTEIVLTTDDNAVRKTYIVTATDLDTNPTLQVRSAAVNDHVLLSWFDTRDLLLTTAPDNLTEDNVYYISQIIDNTWFTQEFVRLPNAVFDRIGETEWFNSATVEERYQISCLFDQAMPTRIAVGDRARVNFTNGTPLRLRAEPDLSAPEITQMPEGTEFNVIGGSACVNRSDYYRFWQLELDDGTVGWAAEASTTDYFIELVPNTITCDTTPPAGDTSALIAAINSGNSTW